MALKGVSRVEFPIGGRLKELRKNKGLSIAELAERSGVSTGLISQIERNLVVPSVVNLYRIAQALDTDINYFFESSRPREAKITRRGDHKRMIIDQGHGIYELFTNSREGHILDLVRVTLKGGQEYSHEMVTHEGEECGFVVKGILTVLLDGQEYRLYEGDSIYFQSTIPHKYLNNDLEDCISVWAMTPTFF